MTKNEGAIDRAMRIILGAVLIALPLVWMANPLTWLGLAVGAVFAVTGIVGFCPAYRLLGLRTCPAPKVEA